MFVLLRGRPCNCKDAFVLFRTRPCICKDVLVLFWTRPCKYKDVLVLLRTRPCKYNDVLVLLRTRPCKYNDVFGIKRTRLGVSKINYFLFRIGKYLPKHLKAYFASFIFKYSKRVCKKQTHTCSYTPTLIILHRNKNIERIVKHVWLYDVLNCI